MTKHAQLTIEDAVLAPQGDLGRLQARALMVAAVAGAATVAGYLTAPAIFYRAYLVGCLLWLGVAAGLLGLGMLGHVTGGRWGIMGRRVFEAAGRTVPVFLIFLLPILLDPAQLYPWADAAYVAGDELLQHKAGYLNTGALVVRQAIYLLGLGAIALLLSRWSQQHDRSGEEALRRRMQRLSACGLVFFVLAGTIASVDWVMSLDPHWFSSLFGAGWVVGQGLAAWAFLVPMMVFLSARTPHRPLVTPRLFHDYGKLMLAFVVLWGYMTVSQYLIIWSGNLPEEVGWYLARRAHGWQLVSVALMVGHFALPFFVLLSAELKRKPRRLAVVACWVLAMRWLDLFWQVTPSVLHWQHEQGTAGAGHTVLHWLDFAPPVAIGGLWVALLVGQLKKRALLPVQEAYIKEAVAHG